MSTLVKSKPLAEINKNQSMIKTSLPPVIKIVPFIDKEHRYLIA